MSSKVTKVTLKNGHTYYSDDRNNRIMAQAVENNPNNYTIIGEFDEGKTPVKPRATPPVKRPVAPNKPAAPVRMQQQETSAQAAVRKAREQRSAAPPKQPNRPAAPRVVRPSNRVVEGTRVNAGALPKVEGRNLGEREIDRRIQTILTPGQLTEREYIADEKAIHSRAGGRGLPKSITYGIGHTDNNERMWGSLLDLSGNPTEKLHDVARREVPKPRGYDWRNVTTDLRTELQGGGSLNIDIQNTYDDIGEAGGKTLNLGIFKEGQGNQYGVWSKASKDDTVQSILKEMSKRGGFHRAKFGMTDSGLWLPLKESSRSDDFTFTNPDYFEQDVLLGGRYSQSKSTPMNEIENLDSKLRSRGHWNPTLPDDVYAIDLDKTRDQVMGMTKGELEALQPNPKYSAITAFPKDGKVDLGLSVDTMKEIGGSKKTVDALLSDEVKDGLNRARKAAGQPELFNAQLIPGADEAIDGLRKNWRGGAAGVIASGASGEAAKKLVQGDVAGAAGEVATNYAIGAVGESALKKAATSGIGKRIGGAVAKRIPGAVARFAGGTAGSGGLLAPVMAVATAVEIADGVTEGITGKGLVTHGREAGQRAEQRKKDLTAAGVSKTEQQRMFRRGTPVNRPSAPLATEPPLDTPKPAPSAPSVVQSETSRRRAARRGTGGVQARPTTPGGWWDKALGSLGL